MTPKVIELEKLSISIKKALRAYRHMPGMPDGIASIELVTAAIKLGVSVQGKTTLQELLEQTQTLLQAEILVEYDRRAREVMHEPRKKIKKTTLVKKSIVQME